MLPDKQIKKSKTFHYGLAAFCVLFIFYESYRTGTSLFNSITSIPGMIALLVLVYSFYKRFFGKGKIILTATKFKVAGYRWAGWDELVYIYPYSEESSENGPLYFIKFMLTDGSESIIRYEDLELDYADIAALINQYKNAYLKELSKQ
jgi:hypothetical protein